MVRFSPAASLSGPCLCHTVHLYTTKHLGLLCFVCTAMTNQIIDRTSVGVCFNLFFCLLLERHRLEPEVQLISKSALVDSVLTPSLKERIYFHDNTAAGAGYLLASVYSL